MPIVFTQMTYPQNTTVIEYRSVVYRSIYFIVVFDTILVVLGTSFTFESANMKVVSVTIQNGACTNQAGFVAPESLMLDLGEGRQIRLIGKVSPGSRIEEVVVLMNYLPSTTSDDDFILDVVSEEEAVERYDENLNDRYSVFIVMHPKGVKISNPFGGGLGTFRDTPETCLTVGETISIILMQNGSDEYLEVEDGNLMFHLVMTNRVLQLEPQ